MADPAKMALMLELSLSAQPAIDILKSIEQQFANIEASAAKIADTFKTGTTELEQMKAAADGMADAAESTSSKDKEIKTYEQLKEKMLEYSEELTRLGKGELDYNRISNAKLNDIRAMAELYGELSVAERQALFEEENLKGAAKGLQKVFKEQLSSGQEFRYELENLGHSLEGLAKGGTSVMSSFINLAKGASAAAAAVKLAKDLVTELAEEQEHFAKMNYRAAGSTRELMTMQRGFAAGTGLGAEAARKATDAIYMNGTAQMKTKEAMGVLVPMTMKMAYAFGVSEESVASFAKNLSVAGLDAGKMKANIELVTKVIQKAGLSAAEAEKLLKGMSELTETASLSGFSEEQVGSLNKVTATMSALAVEAGASADAIPEAFNKILSDPSSKQLFENAVGVDVSQLVSGDQAERDQAVAQMMQFFNEQNEIMKNANGDTIEAYQARKALGAIAPMFGQSADEAVKFGQKMGQLAAKNGMAAESIGEATGAVGKYRDSIENMPNFDASTAKAFESLAGSMKEVFIPIWEALKFAITPVLDVLRFVLEPIGALFKILGELFGLMGGGETSVKVMTAAMYALGAAIVFLKFGVGGGVIAILLGILVWIKENGGEAGRIFGLIAGGITALGLAIWGIMKLKGLKGFDLVGVLKDKFSGIGKTAADATKSLADATTKTTPAAGGGFVGFMKGFTQGLKMMDGGALKGAFYFMLAVLMLVAPILLIAWVTSELGLTAVDLGLAVGAIILAMAGFMAFSKILVALGPIVTAAMPFVLMIAAGMALLGLSLIPAAVAIWILADAFRGLDPMTILMAAGALIVFVGVALIFAYVASLLGISLIPFLAFVAGFTVGVIGLALAMLLFPTKDFAAMAFSFNELGKAFEQVGSNIGGVMSGLISLVDVLDQLEDKSLSAIWSLVDGLAVLGLNPAVAIGLYNLGSMSAILQSIADSLTSIASAGAGMVDKLLDPIISNEDKFNKSMEILYAYADALDAVKFSSADASAALGTADAKVSPVAQSAQAKFDMRSRESDEIKSRENKKVELLSKILEEEKNTEVSGQAFKDIVDKLDELIRIAKMNPTTHPASRW